MIQEVGCRVRKDSVTVVEALITASPEFFAGKKPGEIKTFFDHAMEFMSTKQNPETILSAVVHMDEKTPHMHLRFVPLTPDRRLSAKEVIGNKKKLIQIWLTKQESQDESLQSRLKSMYAQWKKKKIWLLSITPARRIRTAALWICWPIAKKLRRAGSETGKSSGADTDAAVIKNAPGRILILPGFCSIFLSGLQILVS